MSPMYPTLRYENQFWNKGLKLVAGIDEVGRGALAGPVIVSAVIFPRALPSYLRTKGNTLNNVRDSKLLAANKRIRISNYIKKKAVNFSYGEATVTEINLHGIFKATHMAMRRALKSLQSVEFVLIDAFYIPYVSGLPRKKQLAIKRGDRHCFSIAAASILAKVHRDNLMVKLGKQHPNFQLQNHKGYGTLAHRKAILAHGPQPFHRKLFIRKYI